MKTTRNYKKFSFFKQNRPISEGQIGQLARSISKIDMTENYPIIVDEDLRIIDGQHRFKACQRLKKPIYYTIVKLNGDVNNAMKTINSNQKSWTLPAWINHYAKLGNEDYIYLQDCIKHYKLNTSIAISLVGNVGGGYSLMVRRGTFKRGVVSVDDLIIIYDDYRELFDYCEKSAFVRAFVKLVINPNYNHTEMFPKIIKNRYSMQECATEIQYRTMFEDVLNKRMRKNKINIK